MRTIGLAWSRRDPSMMTDVALQLREGERVLGRVHPLISASEVLDCATWLAAENHDLASQQRLSAAGALREHSQEIVSQLSPETIHRLDDLAALRSP